MADLRQHQETVTVETGGVGLTNVTDTVNAVIRRGGLQTGLCTVFIQHTSASLCIQENADPSVQRDLVRFLDGLAPQGPQWEHDDEGPDDMPAHAKAVVTRTSETIPVTRGMLSLGTWQGLYVLEHRARPHTRRLVVHVQGS
jgi:secondary thiamine-phosphate synthase enzyme